jgi:hypothetical protein
MPTLRFVFTGICALTPGYPRGGGAAAASLTAVMPQARSGRIASDGSTYIAAHFPFLVVPLENLAATSRGPDYVLTKTDGDEYAVIFLAREELSMSPAPSNALSYALGSAPIGERPTPENVTDIRWAADFREIAPQHASLRPGCLAATNVDGRVAARVRIDGGVVSSRFPCPEGPSTTIVNAPEPLHRQFAQEIVASMELPSSVTEVVLQSSKWDAAEAAALNVVVQFIAGADVEVMIANGPLDSLMNLRDNECAGHEHPGAIDYEFELYREVIDYPAGVPFPLPQTDPVELRHIDCYAMFVE